MVENGQRCKLLVEILPAIAVVLTLVFVGLELRETARQTALNTESVQVAAYQDLIAQISRFNQLLLDPPIASVMVWCNICLKHGVVLTLSLSILREFSARSR